MFCHGDLNLRMAIVGNSTPDSKGRRIDSFVLELGELVKVTSPSFPTHLYTVSGELLHSTLEFAIGPSKVPFSSCRTIQELDSDHYPVLYQLGKPLPGEQVRYVTDWGCFRSHISRTPIYKGGYLHSYTVSLQSAFRKKAAAASQRKVRKPFLACPFWDAQLKRLKSMRNLARESGNILLFRRLRSKFKASFQQKQRAYLEKEVLKLNRQTS